MFNRVTILICCFAVNAFCIINARIAVTKSQLMSFLEKADAGSEAKLVFCEGGKSYLVDFSRDDFKIEEIVNADSGILPVISPDGKYYTFAKGVPDDALSKRNGRVYFGELKPDGVPLLVADTGFIPRFVQNSGLPEVLYSTCLSHPEPSRLPCDGCGAVVKKSVNNGEISAPVTIWGGGSYFGGLSWDNRFLATAWPGSGKAYMLDREVGNPKPVLTFLKSLNIQNLSDTMVEIGACSPSISSSRIFTDAMMFVDFGSDGFPFERYSPLGVSANWKRHEFIRICNFKGEILRSIGQKYKPQLSEQEWYDLSDDDSKGQSFQSVWDYPEWSNHPYLAVVSVLVTRGWKGELSGVPKNEHIYLINIKDTSAIPLISVVDTSRYARIFLTYPWFWTSIPKDFSEKPGWLSPELQLLPGNKYKKRDPLVKFRGNQIKSSVPIEQIAVYDVSGRCLWKTHFTTIVSVINIPEQSDCGKICIIQAKPYGYPCISFRSIKIE